MKSNYIVVVSILIIILVITVTLNISLYRNKTGVSVLPGFFIQTVSAEEIYPMFVCPCCGQPLDKKNICCGSAQEMIDYIDSLVGEKLSKDEVVIKAVQKYGVTSVIE